MSRNLVITTGGELTVAGKVRADGVGIELDTDERHGEMVKIPLDKQPMRYVLVPAATLEALLTPRAPAPAVSDRARKPAKKVKAKRR